MATTTRDRFARAAPDQPTVHYTCRHFPVKLLDRVRVIARLSPESRIEDVIYEALAIALPAIEKDRFKRFEKERRKQPA